MFETLMALKGAERAIEGDGWTTKVMEDARGRRCMLGAILYGLGQNPNSAVMSRRVHYTVISAALEILKTVTHVHPEAIANTRIRSANRETAPNILAFINDNFLTAGEALRILRLTIERIENGNIGEPKRIIESVPEKTPIKAPEPVKVPEKVPAKVTYYYNDAPIPAWASFNVTKLDLTEFDKVLTNA